MSGELHIVGFKVGRESYGVPITALHEIVRVPEITAVPEAPDYIEGVINLRGKIVSVIDLRKRFGEKEISTDRKNRVMVVEVDKKGGVDRGFRFRSAEAAGVGDREPAERIRRRRRELRDGC